MPRARRVKLTAFFYLPFRVIMNLFSTVNPSLDDQTQFKVQQYGKRLIRAISSALLYPHSDWKSKAFDQRISSLCKFSVIQGICTVLTLVYRHWPPLFRMEWRQRGSILFRAASIIADDMNNGLLGRTPSYLHRNEGKVWAHWILLFEGKCQTLFSISRLSSLGECLGQNRPLLSSSYLHDRRDYPSCFFYDRLLGVNSRRRPGR